MNNAICSNMIDTEIVILSEINQTDKEKHHDISYMQNLKINETSEIIYKIETDSHT